MYLKTAAQNTNPEIKSAACRKYEEGPAFTLLTKKNRLCQTWHFDYATGSDSIVDQVTFEEFEFKKNGDFVIDGAVVAHWEFVNDKENISLDFPDGSQSGIDLAGNDVASDLAKLELVLLKKKELGFGLGLTTYPTDVKLYYKNSN